MSLKICILASGSSGNCTYVASEQTALLVDAGLSCRETLKRLESMGIGTENLKAICVTHEHDDHIACLGVLHRQLGLDLYANGDTIKGASANPKLKNPSWKQFWTGEAFTIGELTIEPFSVLHNACDPVGFVISSGQSRVAVVTDVGRPTQLICTKLRSCQVVILESNYDEFLLNSSERPWAVKQRIKNYHFSNEQASQLISDIAGPDLRTVFLAHMSPECNKPEIAVKAAKAALVKCGFPDVAVKLTYGDKASDLEAV